MADDNQALRYGVDLGLGVLGLALGAATGDKELTRSAYKATGDSTRTLTGTQSAPPATAQPFEPPRQLPGKVETVPAQSVPASQPVSQTAAGAAPAATSTGKFDPFTLEPR